VTAIQPVVHAKRSPKRLTRAEVCARIKITAKRLEAEIESGRVPKPAGRIGYVDYWLESEIIERDRERKREFATKNGTLAQSGPKCIHCKRPMVSQPEGRPKTYCSRACQQASYRARKREAVGEC
jgi:hypothetical protein